ncbi:MAG: NCS1 family nucleobase:cation symporter-1 [Candidatus Eiseniibacteriota bacterium]
MAERAEATPHAPPSHGGGHAHELPVNLATGPYANPDISPTSPAQRTWNTYHIAALWIGMSVCIPTYMLAAGLIQGGMSWSQALGTIALGNVIVLLPMILNAHSGTKYGIPFPVLARAPFGVRGSNLPAILRAIVACGWFGIQTWIGGAAIHQLLAVLWPGWIAVPGAPAIAFLAFWAMNVYFIWNGTESIKILEAWSAPFLIISGLALLAWAINKAGGFGPILSQPSQFKTGADFWGFFVPSLTGMVGFWSTLALNIPDFTRYAKSQRDQMLGQALGLPPTMTLFAFIGVAVTSATIVIYGEAIWDPVVLLGRIGNPIAVAISVFAIIIATLTTNIAANVVSPANDFSNLAPRKISFRTGGLITAFIGIAMMPWKLLEDYGSYIFGWLVGYSGFLGPIAGILIADYFVVRGRTLVVEDLYRGEGRYWYKNGWNPKAVVALLLGVAVAVIGLVVPSLRILYSYAWFVGFAVSFVAYAVLMGRVERSRA